MSDVDTILETPCLQWIYDQVLKVLTNIEDFFQYRLITYIKVPWNFSTFITLKGKAIELELVWCQYHVCSFCTGWLNHIAHRCSTCWQNGWFLCREYIVFCECLQPSQGQNPRRIAILWKSYEWFIYSLGRLCTLYSSSHSTP